jgi:excisionase family DNA binding protein
MDEFKKLYTVEDIAKMTSLTSRTIRNYLKDGSLKGQKIGGQWRFTMENIKRLFDNSSFMNDVNSHKKQQVLDFIDGVNTVTVKTLK